MAFPVPEDDEMKKSFIALGFTIAAGLAAGLLSQGRNPSSAGSLKHTLDRSGSPNVASRASDERGGGELVGAALGALSGVMELQDFARLGEVLPLLDAGEIHELLNGLEKRTEGVTSPQLEGVFTWLLKHRSAAATDWILPRLSALAQDGPRDPLHDASGFGKMIVAWAKADPEGAIAFTRNYPNLGISQQLLTAAVRNVGEQEASAGLAKLLEFPIGRARTGAFVSLLADWAKRDSPAAFAFAAGLEPGEARDQSTRAVLGEWAANDARAALEIYRSARMEDAGVLATVLEGLTRSDPAAAVAALEGLPTEDFVRCAPRIVVEWCRHDPAAALTWAMERGLSLQETREVESAVEHLSFRRIFMTRERGVGSPLLNAFATNPDATVAWLRSLPEGPARDDVYEIAAGTSPHPKTALQLFSELPPDAASRAAFDIAKRFAVHPEVGLNWIESLPPGAVRQRAFAGFGASGFGEEPSRIEDRDAWLSGRVQTMHSHYGLKEAVKISNPTLRKDMVELIFQDFRGTAEERSRAINKAMDDLGLSEESKRRLLD
jgi:hypothetical protein